MNKKNEISSFFMWIEQTKIWPFQFFKITISIFIMVPFSLALLVLLPYFIQTIQSGPSFLTWNQFLGNQFSIWLIPFVKGTILEKGISIELQKQWFALLLLGVSFCYGFFNYISDSMLRDYGERIAKKYRSAITKKYLSLTFKEASQVDAGLLSAMVGEDMREAQQSFTRLMSSILKDGFTSVIFILWLLLLDYQLFVLFVAILIPAAIVLRITGKTLKKLSRQGLQFESDLLNGLLERMRGWQTIQVFKAVDFEIKNFNKINDKIYHVWRRATRARSLGSPLVEWLGIMAGAFILITALRRIDDGLLSSQILTGFMVTVGFLSDKINRMSSQLNTTRKGTDALHRILKFISTPAPQRTDKKNHAQSKINASLEDFELKNLSIGNSNSQVIAKNINFKAKKGSLVAIIGPSGVGKSTLIRTLLGVQKQHEGFLLLNNKEMNEELFESIASEIGFIPQDPFLFTGTIYENILYPKRNKAFDNETKNKALNSLKLAQLDKQLEENINGLSGGEKQRLMFARIFFHNPKLIIIDEGTSALDIQNEQKIIENLKATGIDSVTFIVSHRPLVLNYATHTIDLSNYTPA
jgi:ABC-type multidrug transport system fused ATPase/permease subunit